MSAVSPEAVAASADYAPTRAPTWRSSRGWLMRRLLLLADVVGLVTAFVVAQRIVGAPSVGDTVVPQWELVLFCASLPLWVILARLHGLYDRDEERTDHSSVDDFFGVLQMVTIGTWIFLVGTHIDRARPPDARAAGRVLGARHRVRLALPRPHPRGRPAPGLLRAERPHRRLGQRRAAPRREDGQAPRLRAQHRRLRRPRRGRRAERRAAARAARHHDRRSGSSSISTGSTAW